MPKSKETAKDSNLDELRKQLLALLNGGQAHATFDDAIKDLPVNLRGKTHEGLPYSIWQLLDHMRITQRDILDFCAPPTGGYQPLEWPAGYWTKSPAPPSPHAWDECISTIRSDRKKFEALLTKPDADLYKPFRWGEGQNLLREALLIADHDAYHLGEIVILRRLFGAWHK
jgi:hypothetical protein